MRKLTNHQASLGNVLITGAMLLAFCLRLAFFFCLKFLAVWSREVPHLCFLTLLQNSYTGLGSFKVQVVNFCLNNCYCSWSCTLMV